jgi:hypothetical protein
VTPRTLLVVEDGREYSEAFERLAAAAEAPVRILRAGSLAEARAALETGGVAGVFLDVVFDRVPEAELAGPLAALLARFGGDRARALGQLAESQGFYLLDLLAPLLAGLPVVIGWDFSREPGRLAALRERLPGLEGLGEDAPLSTGLARLLERL